MEPLQKTPAILTAIFLLLCTFTALSYPQPATPEYIMLKCSFHTHTTFSDGAYTPAETAELYAEAGYDCIAITDHDTVDGYVEAARRGNELNLLVIQGEEVTVQGDDGYKHMVALFINTTILDSKVQPTRNYFDAVHEQNGIAVAAHPWLWQPMTQWLLHLNSTWIDGWEFNPAWATLPSNSIYKNFYFHNSQRSFLVLANHDWHGDPQPCAIPFWTMILAHNRTLAGAREALDGKRTVVYANGRYCGTPENIALFTQQMRWDTVLANP